MGIRTPLARVRGLGSAKDGTHHWWMQRVTAVAMIPLMIWLVASLIGFTFSDQAAIATWLQSPCNALLMTLFLLTACYHGKLGMQVVIEDYIHCKCSLTALLMVNAFAFIVLGAMTLLAIIKLHLGAPLPL